MTKLDCTKLGYYRTRDDRIAQVAGYNPKAIIQHQVVGWVDTTIQCWTTLGMCYPPETHGVDLIEFLGTELPRKQRAFKVGDVTKTLDGRPARIICVNRVGEFPLIALIEGYMQENVFMYDLSGKSVKDGLYVVCDLMPMYEEYYV